MSMSTLFKKYTTESATPTEALVDRLRNQFAVNGNPLDQYKSHIFSFENHPEHIRGNITMSLEELENTLLEATTTPESDNVESEGLRKTDGFRAGVMAAAAANSYDKVIEATSEKPTPGKRETLIEPFMLGGAEADVGRIQAAMESYDTTETKNTMMLSFTYNLKAARQNQFGEALFPTVVLAPDVATVTITVDLLNVMEETKRNLDGTYKYQWDRKSLVAALVYPDILHNDTTRIYPIVRNGDPKNLANFVDPGDVAPYPVELEDKNVVETAPLKMGADFDLLGLGSADYLIGNGSLDFTDQIDPSVKLSALYLKLKDGSVIAFKHLEVMPTANFVYGVQENNRTVVLNFDTRSMMINGTTKKVDSSPLNNAITTNNLSVSLKMTAYGKLNLDTGQGQMNSGRVSIASIHNDVGDRIPTDKGVGQAVATELEDAQVIGYDLITRRINTNRRERGQLLDINQERMVYGLPILAPISVVRPAIEGETKDSARLDALVTATYIRCSNAAVSALLAAEEHMATMPPVYEPELLYSSEILGAARYFVQPYYRQIELDVVKELNTLRSADRIVDVNAVIVNTAREMVYDGYLKSNYQAAADVLQGENGNKKPKVIIATDPYIAAYIQLTGDTRSFGDEFDFEVVSTPDIRMRGRMYMVFGKNNPGANDVANPLHFGNMFWRPELTSVLPISRNNTISREMTVQPSFLHVVHCPVMMSIKLKNLPAAVTKMAPVYTEYTAKKP